MLNSFQTLKPDSDAPTLHANGDKPSVSGFLFMEQERGCVICGEIKAVSGFYRRSNICKICRSDVDKEARAKNPIVTKLINPLAGEDWQNVNGFETLYRVSSLGRVTSLCKSVLGLPRSRRAEFLLKPYFNKVTGYWCHVLSSFGGGVDKMIPVHRLVAIHFLPNPLNLPEVNHRFGDKGDNRACSLEWVSRSDNIRHAYKTGLMSGLKGEKHPKAKLTERVVIEIFKSDKGSRQLSRELNMPYSTIANIKNGYNWTHITGLPLRQKRKVTL